MDCRIGIFRACIGLFLVCMTGCQIGPGRLKVANSHYSDAVRVAQAEQMLANLVRLRYREAALFLAVTNISTQFEIDTSFSIDGSVVSGGADSAGLGTSVRYSERPTISFSIMGGETFQKRILSPLDTAAISLLAESGWRGERVLRLSVEQMNGLPNAPTASGPTPANAPKYEEFLEATRLLGQLHDERLVNFEFVTRKQDLSAPLDPVQVDAADTVNALKAGIAFVRQGDGRLQLYLEKRRLVMRFPDRAAGSEAVARLRELLHLEAGRQQFDVVDLEQSDFDPLYPDRPMSELGINSRSLMGVLYYLSNGVEVPLDDLESGVVTATVDSANNPFDWSELLSGLFEVRVSDSLFRPDGAAVAIRHRDLWFYIDDSDQSTKSTFLLLGDLFTLQAGDVEELKPVLTLPVGR